jgi:hypothetical protein
MKKKKQILDNHCKIKLCSYNSQFSEKYFRAEADDHPYDDVYKVVRKTVDLFGENGNVQKIIRCGRPKTKAK